MDYLGFNTEKDALAAEAEMAEYQGIPSEGRESVDIRGKLRPHATKTTCWATPVKHPKKQEWALPVPTGMDVSKIKNSHEVDLEPSWLTGSEGLAAMEAGR